MIGTAWRIGVAFCIAIMLFATLLLAPSVARAETCRLPLPEGAARISGFSEAGPYNSLQQCQAMAGKLGVPDRCYCTSSGPSNQPTYPSGPSQQQLYQQQQEEAARREAERRAEEQRRAEADRQRFNERRDEAVRTLKPPPGTGPFGTGGLRGVPPAGAGIRDLKPAREQRDLGGETAAWKQLNCAASMMDSAFGTVLGRQAPDYDRFSYLAGQATSALNGDRVGEPCPPAHTIPKFNKPIGALKGQLAKLITRGRADAAILKAAQARQKSALDDLIHAKKTLAALPGASSPALQQEIVALTAQRQALGPATLRPPPAPPAPGATPPPKCEPGKVCCPKCVADAAAAERRAVDAAKDGAGAKERLTKGREAAAALAKGDPEAETLLAAFPP